METSMFRSLCLTIDADDADSLASFYRTVLGFEERFRKASWIELEARGLRLSFRQRSELERAQRQGARSMPSQNSCHLGLQSTVPLMECAQRLKTSGVVLDGSVREDSDAGVTLLYFLDPEGNRNYFWHLEEQNSDAS